MSVSGVGIGDIQAAFCATLCDEWVRNGVTHAVICPGSRSTPLAVALARNAGIEVIVRLDERSAAFVALGIGQSTGRPAVLLTTSGTAAVECHPAVAEALLAGVPLLVCTADRPPELQGVGAPQTLDQTRLYGPEVPFFAPGVPDGAVRHTWRSLACRSATLARTMPGPVQVNLAFREPLLGDVELGGGVSLGRPDGRPWHEIPDVATEADIDTLAEGWWSSTRGLVLAGAGIEDPEAVLALARLLGWPVLADPRSGVRSSAPGVIAHAESLVRAEPFGPDHRPDAVLRLGERWASKAVFALSQEAEEVVVEAARSWRDPEQRALAVVSMEPGAFCRSLLARLQGSDVERRTPGAWWDEWVAAEAAARAVLADEVETFSEPGLARLVAAIAPDDGVVVVSSSMPIRDLEAFAAPRSVPARVLSNRGVNGIDGVVSTAIGVSVATGAPTIALVGDLAFLHDLSALLHATHDRGRLTVVVADNGGGGIFSFLAPATALPPDEFEPLFATPPTTDVAAAAAGCGWPVLDVGPGDDLRSLLTSVVAEEGCRVVRVRLGDRAGNVAEHHRLHHVVAEALPS